MQVSSPVKAGTALAAAIGLGLALSLPANAQEASPPTDRPATDGHDAEPSPERRTDAVTLDGVTVTAQRRTQRIQDVPLTVSALSEQALQESGVVSIFDLPAAVSGLVWGGQGNHTQPSIRGVSASVSVGGAENSNSLYVDGVFYSQAQLLGANLPDVERVEVLKGPQGTLFGRNAVGGAIRIFTRSPTFVPTGDFSADFGYYTGGNGSRSAPHYTLRGFVSAPLVEDLLAFSVSAAYDYTDGWMTEEASGDRYGVVERSNARVKLLLTPNEDSSYLLNAYHLKHDDRGLQGMTPVDDMVGSAAYPGSIVSSRRYHTSFDVGPDRDGRIRDWDTADVESKGISLQAEWNLDAGTLTSITSHNEDTVLNYTTIHQSRGTVECLLFFACLHLNRPMGTEAFSQELNFSSAQLGRYRFTAGLFYFDQNHRMDMTGNDTVYPGGVPLSFVRLNLTSMAGYGELQVEATDRLTAILGGRYTREKRRDHLLSPDVIDRAEEFSSFIPRVSLLYKLSPTTNVYATYSVGEASGLSGVSNPGNGYLPVDPEENSAIEVGLKYATRAATFDVAAFYYDYKNKQEQGWTGTAVIHQNTGPVRIYGVDASGTFRIGEDFTLRGNLSWVPEAEYRDFPDAVGFTTERSAIGDFQQIVFDASGYRLQRAPELTGNLTLAYDRPLGGGAALDASATVFYSSKAYHDIYHVVEQGAYATLSARAGYTFGSGLRLGVYGRNLTNEAYIFHAFGSGNGFTANYSTPREVGVAVSYFF